MKTGNLPFNWFDLFVVVFLLVGVLRGKKRGMSEEFFDLIQWLAIVVVSALVYQPLGQLIMRAAPFNLLYSYVVAYLLTAIFVRLIFGWLKGHFGEKLTGSDLFGGMEYYLGMVSGMIRAACVLMVVLAFLNARYFTPEEMAREAKIQRDSFGTITFPTLGSLQQTVFRESLSGGFVKNYLSSQLIAPTHGDGKAPKIAPLQRRGNRGLDEVLR